MHTHLKYIHNHVWRNLVNYPQGNETTTKIDNIIRALEEELQHSCVCSITKDNIAHEPFLVCSDIASHFVTYRSGLSGTSDIDSQMLISYIEDWVSSSPNVNVQGTLIKVDSECPVSITSYNDDLCSDVVTTTSKNPTSNSNKNSQQSTDISGAITGGVLAVLVIAIGLVVLLVLLWKSCPGEWSFRKFEQYVDTNI